MRGHRQKTGRPALDPEGSTHLTVRLGVPDAEALRALAVTRGRRLSDITREAILRYIEQADVEQAS